ncbi:hypothetical protein HHK36_021967 [Tetracentron sinense]|uniref:Uncharacterized protein n=1 Tax=Tetracentron sinense TaxID=13715 RepID=A0A834YS81_TETSI|nr:hypothetical protein HHK36_021967 [Tetracentron sinense]
MVLIGKRKELESSQNDEEDFEFQGVELIELIESDEDNFVKEVEFSCAKIDKPMVVTYALTPHYYNSKYIASPALGGRKRSRNVDDVAVVEGVMKALETIAHDEDLLTILRGQFAKFSSQSALFSMQAAKVDAFLMSALEWWSMFNESYHEGPFKKWDIDRDEGLFDDSSAELEELRWTSFYD